MTTAIINTQSPFQNQQGREALDLAMVLATYEQDVTLFFHQQGVLQLKQAHQANLAGRKDYTKTFAALELYDVEQVYVEQTSLEQYGLTPEDLSIDVEVLTTTEFNQAIAACNPVLSF